jgi:hypothetical protein
MQVNRAGAEKTETGTEEGAWRHRQEARNRERKQRNRAGAAKTEAGGRKQGQEALSIEHFCVFSPIFLVDSRHPSAVIKH